MVAIAVSHFRFEVKRTSLLVILFSCLVFFALPAHAVEILNAQNASHFDRTNTPFTIYGGIAGSAPTSNINTPYDNCASTTGLLPCNNARIHPNLRLVINYKSTTGTGKPALYYMGSGSGTSTTSGQLLTSDPLSPGTAAAGAETYVVVPWSEVCRMLAGDAITANCDVSGIGATATSARGTFKVGFQASATDQTMQSDGADIQIAIGGMGANNTPSVVEGCDITDSSHGICAWEVMGGDQKAILVNPRPLSGRTGPSFNFRAVRLYYLPVPVGQEGTPPFDSFSASTSTYRDLNIDSTASGELSVTPGRVDGLTNDQTYMFKLAMVDLAGNVGYFTSSGFNGGVATNQTGDFYCENNARTDSVSGLNNCHVATPGEVVGALKENSCFIATAAYGSGMAPQVEIFRQFRNEFLVTNRLGSRFVASYYEYGPKYAQVIAHNEVLRTLARTALWPFLAMAWLSLQIGIAGTLATLLTVMVGGFWLIQSIRRKRARAI